MRIQLLTGNSLLFSLPNPPKSYIEHTLFAQGVRFFFPEMNEFNSGVVDRITSEALKIKDVTFAGQIRQTIGDWAIHKRNELLNNKKSPYREELKQCEYLHHFV